MPPIGNFQPTLFSINSVCTFWTNLTCELWANAGRGGTFYHRKNILIKMFSAAWINVYTWPKVNTFVSSFSLYMGTSTWQLHKDTV